MGKNWKWKIVAILWSYDMKLCCTVAHNVFRKEINWWKLLSFYNHVMKNLSVCTRESKNPLHCVAIFPPFLAIYCRLGVVFVFLYPIIIVRMMLLNMLQWGVFDKRLAGCWRTQSRLMCEDSPVTCRLNPILKRSRIMKMRIMCIKDMRNINN